MLEKILKEIEQRVKHYRDNNPGDFVDVCAGLRQAEAIIHKHMNDGWIPVEERLPKDDRYVLVCDVRGAMDLAWWDGKRWWTGFSHADIARDVIAWQPLPDPYTLKKETETDWGKVPVDTPIYVRSSENAPWIPRHFAFYKNGKVFAWEAGETSFTCDNGENDTTIWEYAKLAQEGAE